MQTCAGNLFGHEPRCPGGVHRGFATKEKKRGNAQLGQEIPVIPQYIGQKLAGGNSRRHQSSIIDHPLAVTGRRGLEHCAHNLLGRTTLIVLQRVQHLGRALDGESTKVIPLPGEV
ncbi:MAG: hypothetical protein DLM70_12745 [Chloroflexi bacterium]|nr:MAG: hypothetical protein DLM70_12745 [Chloroflexota bacterium]